MSMFTKATRKRAWLKMAVTGPSGSGKTLSALYLARGLVGPTGRIAVIDTENESASLYSEAVDFDACPLSPPFTTGKYIEAINDAVAAGFDCLIIDSITHEWAGEGGILQQKDSMDARGGNSFTNWGKFTKPHEEFKSAILHSPIHVICTIRSKQEYVVEQNGQKTAPKKVGLAPIQRDGIEYEFTTVLDIAINHEAAASKDRTGLFDGRTAVLTVNDGVRLRAWLDGGAVEFSTKDDLAAAREAYEVAAFNELGNKVADADGGCDAKKISGLFIGQTGIKPSSAAPSDYHTAAARLKQYIAEKAGPAPAQPLPSALFADDAGKPAPAASNYATMETQEGRR